MSLIEQEEFKKLYQAICEESYRAIEQDDGKEESYFSYIKKSNHIQEYGFRTPAELRTQLLLLWKKQLRGERTALTGAILVSVFKSFSAEDIKETIPEFVYTL